MPFSVRTPKVGEVINVAFGGLMEFETTVKARVLNGGQNIIILDVPLVSSCHLPTELVLRPDGSWTIYRPQDLPLPGRIFVRKPD
jgi:hypothetical protein